MKNALGIFLILTGIILGLYVGVWICFIGGIVGVITNILSDNINAFTIAINILKIVCASLAGWISAILLIIPGWNILE